MNAARASVTAIATSLARAVHSRCDSPVVFDDLFGDRFITADERAGLLAQLLPMLRPDERAAAEQLANRDHAFDRAVRANAAYGAIVIRARYAEDQLALAIGRGVRQYVVVGAGLDTFAFRHPDLMESLHVFEIDHPATQTFKRQRLALAGLEPPARLHFVAADLERESVAEALGPSAYQAQAPAFFSCLGITPFLSREHNQALLRGIASAAAPGSEVVFDYLDLDAFSRERASDEIERLRTARAQSDEPWVSGFDPAQLGTELSALGLRLVENLSAGELDARYCAGRTDGLRMVAHAHLARAARG